MDTRVNCCMFGHPLYYAPAPSGLFPQLRPRCLLVEASGHFVSELYLASRRKAPCRLALSRLVSLSLAWYSWAHFRSAPCSHACAGSSYAGPCLVQEFRTTETIVISRRTTRDELKLELAQFPLCMDENRAVRVPDNSRATMLPPSSQPCTSYIPVPSGPLIRDEDNSW